MSWSDPLLFYCERQGPGLLAEPLNALSNLAFFYGAWKLWSAAAAGPARAAAPLRGLAILMALVGAGSLAFHTFATRWAHVLDLAFIGLFNLAYLALFLRLVARWAWGLALAATAGFFVLDRLAAAQGIAALWNGSGTYLPAILALAALAAYALRLAPSAGHAMAVALLAFLVSVAARTADLALCGSWPWGTHFLWHTLNAWVLYRLGRALQTGAAESIAGG